MQRYSIPTRPNPPLKDKAIPFFSGRTVSRRIRMRPRDQHVIGYIGKFRTATPDEIREKFWGNRSTTDHYRRLRQYVEHGFIEPVPGNTEARTVYRLTKACAAWLEAMGYEPARYSIARPSYPSAYQHDKQLAAVQRVVESSPLVSHFQPEHEVRKILSERHGGPEEKAEGYKVPDAWFLIRNPKGEKLRAALELELSLKSSSRYENTFTRMAAHSDVQALFYVFPSRSHIYRFAQLLEHLCSKDDRIRAWRRKCFVYSAVLDELTTKKLAATWEGEGTTFSLE